MTADASPQQSQPSALRRALAALEQMQARLDASERARHEPIAIVGMGCRFPGGASGPDAFWRLLREGGDAVAEVPRERWNVDALYDPDPDAPGKMASRWGAFLEQVDEFDPQLFGITPREAAGMDPQQRLLLEVGWSALEHAGIAPDRLSGSRTGVYVGIVNSDYEQLCRDNDGQEQLGAYYASGNAHSVASGRLSYLFGLQGPSISIDTACSSSLVAVHLAVQGLRAGECDMALAGGVNVILVPESSIAISRYRMLSPDGRCKTFDASADGFARGEGCGVVVLKRLPDALADGDRVLAVIRGSAVNQDGPSSGLTAPSGPAQEAVLRDALADAGLSPREVTYVEAHGTGTALGDPIEVQALAAVLGRGRGASDAVRVGSVKTNLGHLESAAGIAGLVKLVLCLQHREIPPHLHLRDPNPLIPWERLPVAVPRSLVPWPAEAPRVGGVSGFGFSGTNAHLVVAAAPEAGRPAPAHERPCHLLALSARSEPALRELARTMEEHLATHPDELPGDVAHTTNAGRAHLPHRLALRAPTTAGMREQLGEWLAGGDPPAAQTGQAPAGDPPRVGFLFTGQGSQRVNMGRRLFETQPTFRAVLERCEEILRGRLEHPLCSVLYPAAGEEDRAQALLDRTEYTQPALFALEYALSELWRSWGVEPAAVLGHSVGEYVAACVAGVFPLEEGLRLVAERGRLMQSLPEGGAMATVFAGVEEVEAEIAPWTDRLSVAAVNGPGHVVLSGEEEALGHALERFEAQGVRTRRLRVAYAFHSPLVEPVLEPFAAVAGAVPLSPPRLRLVSNVTGRMVAPAELTDPGYWVRHLRRPVRFAEGMAALREEGLSVFLEVGPGTTLLAMGRQCPAREDARWIPSLRQGGDDWEQILDALAALYVHGVPVDWEGHDLPYGCRPVALPTYPFQRQRYWIAERPVSRQASGPRQLVHPLLGRRLRSALPETQFEVDLAADGHGFIADHRVQGAPILPAAAFVELALAAAGEHLRPEEGGLGIEDLVIAEPLGFDGGAAVRTVQTVVGPDAGIRVLSQGEDEEGWRLHATGRLLAVAHPAKGEPPAAIRDRCTEEVPAEEHYARMRGHGLDFGPSLRAVAQIHRRDGEALGKIRAPAEVEREAGAFRLHPALLDACLQVLSAALPTGAPSDPYLPLSLGAFRFFRRPAGALWSHAVLHAPPGPLPDTIEGEVRLLDERGEVLAEATGLVLRRRAARPAVAEDVEDWLYRVEWRPAPREPAADAAVPAALSTRELAGRIEAAFPEAAVRCGLNADLELAPRVEALGTMFVLDAFRRLGWAFEPGRRFAGDTVAGSCGILPRYRRLLDRLLGILEEEGVLARAGTSEWEVLRAVEPRDPEAFLAGLLASNPAAEAQLSLTAACGRHLAEALTGAVDPLSLLFPGGSTELAERLYHDSPKARVFNSLVRGAVAEAVAGMAPGRTLRVLEIGAGTGGTSASVLPVLPPGRTEYVFTDISPAFLTRARERFAEHGFVAYRLLDIEQDPAGQGFAGERFDLVLAVNVLHATADLSQTLRHVRSLLAPDGLLVVAEGTAPERWIDVTFGLTDGWWRFTDTELRPAYPLLPPARWTELLASAGFPDAVAAPADAERHGRAILLARPAPERAPDPGSWLVLGDASGTGERLARLLDARGGRCLLAPAGAMRDDGGLEEWVRDAVAGSAPPPRGIVHLAALDEGEPAEPGSLEPAQRRVCGTVLRLLKTLGGTSIEPPRLWLVTRGAQPAGPPAPLAVAQAPLWGLATILRREHPELRCATVDLDPGSTLDEQAATLLAELLDPDAEDRIALRGRTRYAARLVRCRATPAAASAPAVEPRRSVRLAASPDGVLEHLAWIPAERRPPSRGEVEIRVHATGLNFRDVMNALAMREDPDPLGGECSGRVVAVGEGVREVAVGDEVVAVATGGFGTHATVRADLVLPMPRSLGFVEAAGVPLAFLTASYCLHQVARLAAGESVLVHAAAGGVGLAAVRLARLAGAEVFATAGSPEKREFLRSQGVRHVFDSRSLAFADEVLAATEGRGVDVVLNSLAGEFIPRSLAALAERGRFLEIGKRGVWTSEQAARVRPEARYHVVDLAGRLHADPASVRPAFRDAVESVASGAVEPLPVTVFPHTQVADAFRYMAQARHIGKIVVTQEVEDKAPPARTGSAPRADGTYLVTGGLRGLGLLSARWLAERGAGTLVLLGRRPPSEEASGVIREIEAAGARVRVVQGDVSQEDDVRRLLETIDRDLPPLRGVVHSAGVLEDGALLRQEWAGFARVLAPKVDGAWLLHALTRDRPLDFFVLYSSVASLLGSPGQGGHAAANAFLDALAHHRRASGLPALSIGWGVWSQVGSAAERGMAEQVAGQGAGAISPEAGIRALEAVLAGSAPHVAVQPVNWERYLAAARESPAWLSEVAREARERGTSGAGHARAAPPPGRDDARPSLLQRMADAPAGDRHEILTEFVHEQVARVVGLGRGQRVDPRQPLSELGVDSLMAVELRNRLGTGLGTKRALPATLVFDHPTVTALTEYLAREVPGLEPADAGSAGDPPPADLLDQIEGLSDADVERHFAGIEGA